MNNLTLRIVSAIILIPVVISIILFGEQYFFIAMTMLAGLMLLEFLGMMSHRHLRKDEFIAMSLFGIIYILLTTISICLIYAKPFGKYWLLYLLIAIWSADSLAYFVGRKIGGPKLAPKISPNKTISGLFGAIIGAMIGGIFAIYIMLPNQTIFSSYISVGIFSGVLGFVGQISDLMESWIKRYFGVKDSGNLIPGHGGILDRLDGLTLTAPLLVLILYFGFFV